MLNAIAKAVSGLNQVRASVFVFLIFFILGLYIVSVLNQAEHEADDAHTLQIANGYASSIEKVIRHALSSTNTLAVMVHQGNGEVKHYSELVNYMLPMYKGAYALSLAPNGVMRQIEPAIQNQSVLNHDLFEHQNREKEIAQIVEGKLVFFGPFKLLQGPQGGVGMLPVFLNNEKGQKYFWGFTLVSLKFPEAFEDVDLSELEKEGYAYQLIGVNPKNNQKEMILQSKMPLTENSVTVPIDLYGAEWSLKISKPVALLSFGRLFFEYLLVFLGALLMSCLIYSLIKMSEQSDKLKTIAMIDPLTELPNRRMLSSKLDEILKLSEPNQVVVCYLDLDGFKEVNDRLGHAIGDELLKYTSARLKASLRDNDVIARVGGDEFIVVLTELKTIDEAEIVISRMIQNIDQPFAIGQERASVTASVGAAIYKIHGEEADQLIRAADQAMYLAKNAGKNRFFFAEEFAKVS